MPTRTQINIGSAPGCELVLHGNGVAPRHAVLLWRDGLWIQDLGQGRTVVDGRPLSPNESAQLPGFHSAVTVGDARVPLTSPEISKLFLDLVAPEHRLFNGSAVQEDGAAGVGPTASQNDGF